MRLRQSRAGNDADRVPGGGAVRGDERGILSDSLRDKQVIERIAVVHRQRLKCQEVRGADAEENEAIPLDGVRDLRDASVQLSGAHLHGYLPERGYAGEDVIAGISDEVPRSWSKLLVVG